MRDNILKIKSSSWTFTFKVVLHPLDSSQYEQLEHQDSQALAGSGFYRPPRPGSQ